MTASHEDQALLKSRMYLPTSKKNAPSPGTVMRPIVPFCVTVPLTKSTVSPELIVPVTDVPVTEL